MASLERTLPAGAAVLIADDDSSDPHVEPLARGWCHRSKLAARYLRQERRLGLAANCSAVIGTLEGDEDIVLLHPQALATPGWLQQLARCASSDPRIATLTPWSNDADLTSFPRLGEANPVPDFPEAVAAAAASVAWAETPELPAAVGACLLLRRTALRQLGGLDHQTFPGERATDDFSRRAAAMGWRNALCPGAYVARDDRDAVPGRAAGSGAGAGDQLSGLLARWPDYQELVARFLLSDPLRPMRERLQSRIDELARSGPQRDLFH